jgi:hypothetical protein
VSAPYASPPYHSHVGSPSSAHTVVEELSPRSDQTLTHVDYSGILTEDKVEDAPATADPIANGRPRLEGPVDPAIEPVLEAEGRRGKRATKVMKAGSKAIAAGATIVFTAIVSVTTVRRTALADTKESTTSTLLITVDLAQGLA